MRKVLVVDDERGITTFIKKLLSRWPEKYSITIANNGLDAIKIAEDIIPDIIIVDMKLPDINGHEVSSRIRQNEKMKHTKILAMSGYIIPENEDHILSCGADAYISKPFDISAFLNKLKGLEA